MGLALGAKLVDQLLGLVVLIDVLLALLQGLLLYAPLLPLLLQLLHCKHAQSQRRDHSSSAAAHACWRLAP